jgi:hypothetical protein
MAAPARSLRESLLRSYKVAHTRLLAAAEGLSPEEFVWSAGPSLHSVAWHLWHAARWDDVFASFLHRAFARDPRTQVWERESLADRWALTPGSLGRRDTGTEMSDEMAEELRFPDQKEVISYARLAFAYTEGGIALVPDDRMLAVEKDDPDGDSLLDNVLIYTEHLSRHLGMIESIRGLKGSAGSTTR